MPASLDFDVAYNFNTLESGITVPTTLTYGSRKVVFPAKIDTGSTDCVFERKFADNLKIEIESGEKTFFGTATGRFLAYGHELNVIVLGIEIYTKVYFVEEEEIHRNVLGRAGFLNRVLFGLIDYEGKVFFSPYGDNE